MSVRSIIVAAIALGQVVGALAQRLPEPYHIKDDMLGESLAAYRQINARPLPPLGGLVTSAAYHPTTDCALAEDGTGLKDEGTGVLSCVTPGPDETYAGMAMHYKFVSFYSGRLYLVRYAFGRGRYAAMLQAITQKLGAPAARTARDVENGFGTQVKRETVTWSNGVSTVTLTESSADDLETSVLEFTQDDLRVAVERKRGQSAAEARKSDM
jgi:hypothetical protein